MAANDLTVLANVKQWLGIGDDVLADDDMLTRLVSAISTYVTAYLNRQILSADYTEQYTIGSGYQLTPENWPITAIKSLVINGNVIPASPDGIQDGYVFTDKTVFLNGYTFGFAPFAQGARYLNVTLAYTAGYASVPLDLEQAVINLVSLRYQEKERIGQRSKSIAGEVVSFNLVDMPPDVQAILQMYRRIVI